MQSSKLLEAATCGSTILAMEALMSDEDDEDEDGSDRSRKALTNKSAATKGYTPLMKAANSGHMDVVDFLLAAMRERERTLPGERKFELFRKDHRGRTALDWARIGRKTKVAKRLEAEMAAVIRQERELVAASANAARCKATVERNERAAEQLRKAVDARDLEMIENVLKTLSFTRGQFQAAWRAQIAGDPDSLSQSTGSRPETLESQRSSQMSLSSLHSLLLLEDAPFCLDMETEAGSTPLHLACTQGAVDLVRKLVEKGANPNKETRQGHTALTWACVCGHPAVVETLLMMGSEMLCATKKEDWTPLMHAAYNGQDPCVMLLLDKLMEYALKEKVTKEKASQTMEEKENINRTWMDIFQSYLDHRDLLGQSALDLATMRGHKGSTHILELAEARCLNKARRQQEEDQRKSYIVKCSLGCSFEGRVPEVELHEIRECRFRAVGCADCGEYTVKVCEVDDHQQNHCIKRFVTCDNAHRGCKAEVTAENLKSHLQHKCQYHLDFCRIGCGHRVLRKDRAHHEQEVCPLNMIDCPDNCGHRFLRKELKHHQAHDCAFRMVRCRVTCGVKVRACDLEDHEQKVCIQPCHWDGCCQRVGPKATREVHQTLLCDWRVVPCPYGCSEAALPFIMHEPHKKMHCTKRPVFCRLGCGKRVQYKDLVSHEEAEKGTCPHRLRRCRLDMLGRRFLVTKNDEQMKGTVKQYCAETDRFRIIYKGKSEWERLDQLYYTILDDKNWRCGWVPAGHMEHHLNKICPIRLVACSLGCGQQVLEKLHKSHIQNDCQNREVECSACGVRIAAHDLFHHQEKKCKKRKIQCTHCGVQVPMHEMRVHLEETCAKKPIRCPLGCGTIVSKEDINNHLAAICPKRNTTCPHCKNEDLWAEELEAHLQNECSSRMIQCKMECGATISAADHERHLETDCIMRDVTCECGKTVRFKDMEDHRITDCVAVLRYCSYGCGTKLCLMDMAEHQEKTCPRKNVGHSAIVQCALGCGKMIARTEEFKHITTMCMYRQVECPLKCGIIVRADNLGDHSLTCTHRQVPCGADMGFCTRQLRSWLYMHENKMHMLVCDEHESTPLIWAAANNDKFLLFHLISECRESLEIDFEDSFGENALTRACFGGYLEIVNLLIQHGSKVNQCTHTGYTPLIQAVRGNQLDVVKLLIKERAVLAFKGRNQMTAFDWARQMKLHDILKLLQRTHRIEKDLQLIFCAISHGNIALVRKIVEKGEPYRINHVVTLEKEQQELEEQVKYQEKTVIELKVGSEQYPEAIKKLKQELFVIEAEHQDLMEKAENLENMSRRKINLMMERYQAAIAQLEQVQQGDIFEVARLRNPPDNAFYAMKATCVLLGIEPGAADFSGVRSAQTQGQPGQTYSRSEWWRKSQQFLRDKNFMHRIHHFNKANASPSSIEAIRNEMIRPGLLDGGNLEDHQTFRLVSALTAWIQAVDYYATMKQEIEVHQQQEQQLRNQIQDLLPGLERKRVDLHLEEFRLGLSSTEMGGAAKQIDLLRAKADLFEDRLRVAKLFAVVTPSGHSILSWAAACGQAEIVRLLLLKGATYGYGDEYANYCVKTIQLVWNHYRWVKRSKQAAKLEQNPHFKKQYTRRLAAYFLSISALCAITRRIRLNRRMPLNEAFYAGHYAVADIFEDHKNFELYKLSFSFALPLRPPPYMYDDAVLSEPLNILQCAEMGNQAGGCRDWVHGEGWINSENKANRWVKNTNRARKLWADLSQIHDVVMEARRKRILVEEQKRKRQRLENGMEKAILGSDFSTIIKLFEEGATVDYEAKDGCTALIKAAEEDPEGVHHVWLRNKDGKEVLAVELLLDRQRYRPTLDKESKRKKHTALSWAAYNSRVAVVEALLERGADINFQNTNGHTALIFAAKNGKMDVVRLLLECGADPLLKDSEGRTALDWAKAGNFTEAMVELTKEGLGNKGIVKANRGTAAVLVPCPLGCGQMMRKENFVAHGMECTHRQTECAHGCGIHELLWHEKAKHEAVDCMHRFVPCPLLCPPLPGDKVEKGQVARLLRKSGVERHLSEECPNRRTVCQDCGQEVVARYMVRHLKLNCPERKVPCGLGCGQMVCVLGVTRHQTSVCKFRSLRCRLGCGSDMFAYMRDEHEQNLCWDRQVTCKYRCDQPLTARHQANHEANKCPLRRVKCPAHCPQLVRYNNLKDHLSRLCVNRFIECPLQCEIKIRHVDIQDHVNNSCNLRLLPCELGCGNSIKLRFMKDHLEKECPKRLIPCAQCQEPTEAGMLEGHKEFECKMRTCQCSNQGCYKRLPLLELADHEKFECRRRIVFCLQGCGEEMYAEKRKIHHQSFCSYRYVLCPLGCGESVREKDKWAHMEETCVRRHIS